MVNVISRISVLLMGASEASRGENTSVIPTIITFGMVFVIFYFLVFRPQNKRQKETKAMLSSLKKGDKIVTIGGIRGSIFSLKDDIAVVKVDDSTKLQFSRSAISQVIEQKTESSGKENSEKTASPAAKKDKKTKASTDT